MGHPNMIRPSGSGRSLRRAKASMTYEAAANRRATHILPAHRKIQNTAAYLGVDIDDARILAADN